jgi:hypothetical protein
MLNTATCWATIVARPAGSKEEPASFGVYPSTGWLRTELVHGRTGGNAAMEFHGREVDCDGRSSPSSSRPVQFNQFVNTPGVPNPYSASDFIEVMLTTKLAFARSTVAYLSSR